MKYRKILVCNDLHIPFHDPAVVQLVLDVAKHEDIDELVLNGDVCDFYNLSAHPATTLDVKTRLEDELYAVKEFLENLRVLLPETKITWIFGNHEWRLDRYIVQKCPELWNLFTLKVWCDLEKLKIHAIPYNDAYQIGQSNLFVQHSPPSYGENGARTSLLKKVDRSFIYGCSHRMQHASITGRLGIYNCWFNGWLGSTTLTEEHKKVFSFAKGHENWQQCFSMIHLLEEIEYHVQQIPIINGRLVYNGILYG